MRSIILTPELAKHLSAREGIRAIHASQAIIHAARKAGAQNLLDAAVETLKLAVAEMVSRFPEADEAAQIARNAEVEAWDGVSPIEPYATLIARHLNAAYVKSQGEAARRLTVAGLLKGLDVVSTPALLARVEVELNERFGAGEIADRGEIEQLRDFYARSLEELDKAARVRVRRADELREEMGDDAYDQMVIALEERGSFLRACGMAAGHAAHHLEAGSEPTT